MTKSKSTNEIGNIANFVLMLPQYAKGQLSADEMAQIDAALKKSPQLRLELDEIIHFSKVAQSFEPQKFEPTKSQIDNIMARIKNVAPTKLSTDSKKIGALEWLNSLFLASPTFQISRAAMHALCALIALQFVIAGGLFWQMTKAKNGENFGRERLITHFSPNTTWSVIAKILGEKNLKFVSISKNSDLILMPTSKLRLGELAKIGKDFEDAGIAKYAIYSDGIYETKPIVCENYKSNSSFENRPALANVNLSNRFSTIESIDGEIFGETRNGTSAIEISNLGPEGGWFDLGSKSLNSNNNESWMTGVGRFRNDFQTILNKDNLPLVKVNFEILLGNAEGIYPGKFITRNSTEILNVKYPAQVYNIPGQAKFTGFNLTICGHSRR